MLKDNSLLENARMLENYVDSEEEGFESCQSRKNRANYEKILINMKKLQNQNINS